MTESNESGCVACEVGASKLSGCELKGLMPTIPEWSLVEIDDVKQLRREYRFDNFVQAQAFTNKVADLAEQAGHHPAILLEWGKVTVSWWSHKIRGLHKMDVELAQKTEALYI